MNSFKQSMNNKNIRQKLTSTFTILIVFTVVVGLLGCVALLTSKTTADNLYNVDVTAMTEVAVAKESLEAQVINLTNMAVFRTTDSSFASSEEKDLAENEKKFDEAVNVYEGTITDADDRAAFEDIKADYAGAITDAKNAVKSAIRTGDESSINRAINKLNEETGVVLEELDAMYEWNKEQAATSSSRNGIIALVSVAFLLVVIILAATTSFVLAKALSDVITEPIAFILQVANQAGGEGDFNFTPEFVAEVKEHAKAKDELGEMTGAFAHMMDTLVVKINLLEQIAGGDLSVRVPLIGAKDTFGNALTHMLDSLNIMFSGINNTTTNVSSHAAQVSSGAQSLAQGATEQASSVEELSATVIDVSDHIKKTADNAEDANQLSNQAGQKVSECSQQMQEAIGAMEDISQKSSEIVNVIKVIEDIAFQTNILALNAAVEAARAGAAGKGFAVVADEVRNLASKSQEASQNTAALIESSVNSVKHGSKLINETSNALKEVVEYTQKSATIIEKISTDSREQAIAISQISEGISQISSVVQTTSATSQESAAVSGELSQEAANLKQMIDQFKLR
ncbi:MAG: MCP four helix bundle domain-containing protein [Oscillospiraceae bacterium]|nr:MCP four helix bundle domain-containing protein [Oscillospiraceae bacterium]